MNTTMCLLYELRDFLPENFKDSGSIFRFDLDKETPSENLKLVIVTKGFYYYFIIEDSDFDDLPKLYQLILDHIKTDPRINPP